MLVLLLCFNPIRVVANIIYAVLVSPVSSTVGDHNEAMNMSVEVIVH